MTPRLLSSISRPELSARLRGAGLLLRVSPFVVQIRSPIAVVADGLHSLYADYELLEPGAHFSDFHIEVARARRFPKPQCVFRTDGLAPFTPLALGEAFALMEWGLNWCITGYSHTWITVHSAVLERNGCAVLLPAPPGSGKSTLCAGLMLQGWRLLSDEMALLDPLTGEITPSPRPVSLKNQSIAIVHARSPQSAMGPIAHDTMKGTVAHLQPTSDSVLRASEPGKPAWVVFPKYVAGASTQLTARGKAASYMQLAENSFNQHAHGRSGFAALSNLIDRCDCYDFTYSNLDEAFSTFANLPPPA